MASGRFLDGLAPVDRGLAIAVRARPFHSLKAPLTAEAGDIERRAEPQAVRRGLPAELPALRGWAAAVLPRASPP